MDIMTESPSSVIEQQLNEINIKIIKFKKEIKGTF